MPGLAHDLRAAGVSRLNISLDSLEAATYRQITQRGDLDEALKGLEAAVAAGFEPVKVNTVLIGGVNDGAEMHEMIKLAKGKAPGSRVSLLPYHSIGTDKWRRIGKTPPADGFYTPSKERMAEIAGDWARAGFEVENDNREV